MQRLGACAISLIVKTICISCALQQPARAHKSAVECVPSDYPPCIPGIVRIRARSRCLHLCAPLTHVALLPTSACAARSSSCCRAASVSTCAMMIYNRGGHRLEKGLQHVGIRASACCGSCLRSSPGGPDGESGASDGNPNRFKHQGRLRQQQQEGRPRYQSTFGPDVCCTGALLQAKARQNGYYARLGT